MYRQALKRGVGDSVTVGVALSRTLPLCCELGPWFSEYLSDTLVTDSQPAASLLVCFCCHYFLSIFFFLCVIDSPFAFL